MLVTQKPIIYQGRYGEEYSLGRGYIINLGSGLSFGAGSEMIVYVASKHTFIGITKVAVLDNAKYQIRVNTLCPSWVKIFMLERSLDHWPKLAKVIQAASTAKRSAILEEVVNIAVDNGTVKSDIGHLEGTSGIVGFIKTALVLEEEEIPPNTYFEQVNPDIDAEFLNIKEDEHRRTAIHIRSMHLEKLKAPPSRTNASGLYSLIKGHNIAEWESNYLTTQPLLSHFESQMSRSRSSDVSGLFSSLSCKAKGPILTTRLIASVYAQHCELVLFYSFAASGSCLQFGTVSENDAYFQVKNKGHLLDIASIKEKEFMVLLDHYCHPNQEPPSQENSLPMISLVTSAQLSSQGLDVPDWIIRPTSYLLGLTATFVADISSSGVDYATELRNANSFADAKGIALVALMSKLAKALAISISDIDTIKPLHFGMDSLLAVELRNSAAEKWVLILPCSILWTRRAFLF
ncbi:BcPKS1, polyketide synthase [Sclerotinia borealis F-4128]|uniref:BcPKS1, polyketide synthase n=1 Tax=Sclerotinia borealis (strain F-4128) TaxID=1432307 RepID=W9C6H1_SCLBF|nr:BcPKS1, polyketide synthase [Sclerotinia borealis F-4128]